MPIEGSMMKIRENGAGAGNDLKDTDESNL